MTSNELLMTSTNKKAFASGFYNHSDGMAKTGLIITVITKEDSCS